jgi:redox-sensitive bicupin YhaK (pirin superfamily)
MQKKLIHILEGRKKRITDTESVRQPMPHKDFRFANPFVVLHHLGPVTLRAGYEGHIHPHPHRGFSPVTFMLKGKGLHRDNAGHEAELDAGDVQWMFAGKGILHSEGASPSLLKKGGDYELIQLWINVPAKDKWDEPSYQVARNGALPRVLENNGGDLRLVTGFYEGQQGPLKSHTPMTILWGSLPAEKSVSLTVQEGYWTLLYVYSGEVSVDGSILHRFELGVFDQVDTDIKLLGSKDSGILLLSGRPLDEPLAVRDNFVMNSPEEIDQALADFQAGNFGQLDG